MPNFANYAERIQALASADGASPDAQAVLDAVVERHALSIDIATSPPSVNDVVRLTELDATLRSSAAKCVTLAGPASIKAWRDSVQPPSHAWWWFLDQAAEASNVRPHPMLTLFGGAMFTTALSLAAEISNRFLAGGPDFFGVLGTLTQGGMALVAGSAFTKAGREWLASWSTRFGISDQRQETWIFWMSLALLAAVIMLRLALPLLSTGYDNRAVKLQGAGQVSGAIDGFNRALSLNPDFAEARYSLATAYEDVLEWDKAIGEYQRAIQVNSGFHAAYNNLARLYLLRRNDPATALGLLQRGLAAGAATPEIRYSLLKNRGWALFGLNATMQAEEDLAAAIRIAPDRGEAHCLLALVLEAGQRPAEAGWRACLAYSSNGAVEPQWRAMAAERLSRRERRQ